MIPPELLVTSVVGVAAFLVWLKTGSGLSRVVCLACFGFLTLVLVIAAILR